MTTKRSSSTQGRDEMTQAQGGRPTQMVRFVHRGTMPEAKAVALPNSASDLVDPRGVARFLARRVLDQQPALLLRYGDTGARVLTRPRPDSDEFEYLRKFLGARVTTGQVDWLAARIEASARVSDVIGLRSDLLGPTLPDDVLGLPNDAVLPRLASLYPLRPVDRASLGPVGARRLAETRKAMEELEYPSEALFTDAWIHLSLAEIGFIAALLSQAAAVTVVTSIVRRPVLERLVEAMHGRIRVFACPAYPTEEAQWGGNHDYLWHRWRSLVDNIHPVYAGEPLLISAGIWTKVIGPVWRERGGIALDLGSIMDFFCRVPSRPAVLDTKYDDPGRVPETLWIERQLERCDRLEDFLS